jgi:hypothetical protein
MDEELDFFKRAVNLLDLARTFGYAVDLRSGSASAASVAMDHPVTGDKIVIRRDRDGHWTYFSIRDQRDNGTVVDFLQWRRRLTIGGTRQELRRWLNTERPVAPRSREPKPRPAADGAAVAARYQTARDIPVPVYLAARGLVPATLADSRFRRTFRVDRRDNVLFPHLAGQRVVGFEIKGPSYTGFASGGRKTAWCSNLRDGDKRLVIVEGPIDALSYHQVLADRDARYLSTGGAPGRSQLEFIRDRIRELAPGAELVLATDADPAGERLAEQITALGAGTPARRARPPAGKDWNDYLRALRRTANRAEKHWPASDRHGE